MQVQLSTTQRSTPISNFRIALVCMPFATAAFPSIQLGLLKALAEEAGFPTDSYHLNLDLAQHLTTEKYEALCGHRGHMTGEWLFSLAAFGEEVCGEDEVYFAAFPEESKWAEQEGMDTAYFSTLRHETLPAYIDTCLTMVDWGRYQVIGFSSTFQQNVACLALARRIKERYPSVKIIFGGANFEDEMGPEYVRAFPFIDYAVVGEGDIVFPALLRSLAVHEQPRNMPGVVTRTNEGVIFSGQASAVRNLDALPTPHYDEYFERVKSLGLQQKKAIPFESSRGCWWGQKHHCTFCGLNGLGMTYRAKSASRTLNELSELALKHRINYFQVVDNILDLKYLRNFFTTIAETRTDYQFFYEVKANLTREQIDTLYHGGVRMLQPGIESMNSHVLQLMRKGCTMLQNVRLLKWCRYYGLRVGWNILWGFPGEMEEDYHKELEVLKLLSHLEPPAGYGRIWLERFSPYFSDRELFPVEDVRPEASYRYVYPTQVNLDKAAYFFDYEMGHTVKKDVHLETCNWLSEWRRRWNSNARDTLFYRRTLDALFIDDNRGSQSIPYTFDGPLALVYEHCSETMRTIAQIVEYLQTSPAGGHFPDSEVEGALEEFCQAGLMVSEDGKYLSLAVPVNPNW